MGEINYDYTYYRPTGKRHSYMTGNDVIYTYGTDGGKTGRLISVVDGSGSVDYNYDALGNIIDETRTIAVPNSDNVYQFQMNYSYDSWGRMLQMTYPDGEKVNYTYQWGGDLRSMNGNNVYIDSIRYNPFGQRSAIHYGNGTHVEYTYDDLHRLVNLTSYTASGTPMQQINYTFDNVSNVTSIVNDAGAVNSLGGGYKNNYYYDKLYRLTSSGGDGEIGNYNMGMGYTPSGRIIWKKKNAKSVTLADDAYMHYSYCDDYQPHAVRHIFDKENMTHCDLRWDPAGNLGQISVSLKDNVFDHGRFLFWTVDNRMHAAVDDKHYSYYTYDYTGERRLKLTGESNRLDVNADFMTTGTLLNTPTLYPSAYLVLTSKGYTKHYYAGADRVAASLGGGGLKAVGSNPGMQERADWLFWESHERVNGRMLQENDHKCIWQSSLPTGEYCKPIDGIPGRMKASVEFYLNDLYDNLKMLAEEQHDEKDVYFYHSDHLGSASWITDADGKPIQHLQYLPFGEPFVNQHLTDYQERYLFTGKERDEETGYGYFGARYMDHELTAMWLSVDPMADKYPSISPYAYCAWNPVKLTDPDGNSPISALAKLAAKQGIKKSIKIYAKKNIENRLKAYMNKNIAKQFVKDLDDVISTLDNSWWETGIELIPVVGDLYGGTKFGIKIAKAYDKLQNLENKYVEKIYKSLPKSEREKFKKAMRDAGVRDARRDQREGVESLGETYVNGRQIDGHHKKPVSEDISQSSDPRNIEFMPKEKHRQVHSNNNY